MQVIVLFVVKTALQGVFRKCGVSRPGPRAGAKRLWQAVGTGEWILSCQSMSCQLQGDRLSVPGSTAAWVGLQAIHTWNGYMGYKVWAVLPDGLSMKKAGTGVGGLCMGVFGASYPEDQVRAMRCRHLRCRGSRTKYARMHQHPMADR